jgi:uncharacterized repeat protein (TIGR03803 family)
VLRTALGALILLAAVSRPASAQTLTTLLTFTGSGGAFPGQNPAGGLTLIGSALYGETIGGGDGGEGNMFSINTDGSGFQTLSSFGGGPTGDLTLCGSTFYGATQYGGQGYGSVFSVPVSGGTPTTLLSFNRTNGEFPCRRLAVSGSSVYGMTMFGGAYGSAGGDGTIFSVPMSGGTPTTLLSFDGTDGATPVTGLTVVGSALYGTASNGGATFNGTIFSIPVSGGTPTILANFDYTHGSYPVGSLTLSGSTFFGMTSGGGDYGDGTVFSVPVSGGAITTLLSFNGTNGMYPFGSLTLDGSTLYGAANEGGAYGGGTIFSVNTDGSDFQTLYSFSGNDGGSPNGDLVLSGSTLYGMTQWGGSNDLGTIFALDLSATPEPGALTLLSAGAVGLAGYRFRRRRVARRNAEPIALDRPELQGDDPPILAFPSRASDQSDLARRAA